MPGSARVAFEPAVRARSPLEALHDAYADGRREVATGDICAALGEIVPLAVTMREPIEAMRRWAARRARRASRE